MSNIRSDTGYPGIGIRLSGKYAIQYTPSTNVIFINATNLHLSLHLVINTNFFRNRYFGSNLSIIMLDKLTFKVSSKDAADRRIRIMKVKAEAVKNKCRIRSINSASAPAVRTVVTYSKQADRIRTTRPPLPLPNIVRVRSITNIGNNENEVPNPASTNRRQPSLPPNANNNLRASSTDVLKRLCMLNNKEQDAIKTLCGYLPCKLIFIVTYYLVHQVKYPHVNVGPSFQTTNKNCNHNL